MPTRTRLRAKALTSAPDERGILERRELTDTFSAPALSPPPASATERMPPATQKRNVEQPRHRRTTPARIAVRACGDVVEDELIGARVAMSAREFQDVACDAMVADSARPLRPGRRVRRDRG